ncbi:MAG: hypothetical protein AAF703_06865 [Cyanobacteria bacterium P01_D01_bin.105]
MSIAPSQILFLEHGTSRLYAEAIQIIAPRRLCWARPTLLIQGLPAGDSLAEERQCMIAAAAAEPARSELQLYDLEDSPDLIWPIELFEIAYDVDFFSLLVKLKMNPDEVALRVGIRRLNTFLRNFWKSQPHAFHPTSASADSLKTDGQATGHPSRDHTTTDPRSGSKVRSLLDI